MKYFELKEEIINIYVELSYNSRFIRIAMWHLIGKTLLENADIAIGKRNKIAAFLNATPADIATAILFAKDNPNLDDFNHDKTTSWSQIKHQYAQNKETKIR